MDIHRLWKAGVLVAVVAGLAGCGGTHVSDLDRAERDAVIASANATLVARPGADTTNGYIATVRDYLRKGWLSKNAARALLADEANALQGDCGECAVMLDRARAAV